MSSPRRIPAEVEHGEDEDHDGNEAPVEFTPEIVVEMLGPPAHPDGEFAARTGRRGVALGLRPAAAGGGDAISSKPVACRAPRSP